MSRVAFAFVLLLAGLVHNNAHKWVSPDLKPWVWNITGALYPIVLLVFIAMIVAHPAVWLVVTLLCGFSLQVAGCSVAYLIAPWPLNPNDELCSSDCMRRSACWGCGPQRWCCSASTCEENMADPTSSALGAATFVSITAVIGALLGVEPQALVFSTVGAVFGTPLAPPSGRMRTVLLFLAVVIACAMLGTWAAEVWNGSSRFARNCWSMGIASGFHPLFATFIESAPKVFRAVLDGFARARTGGQ